MKPASSTKATYDRLASAPPRILGNALVTHHLISSSSRSVCWVFGFWHVQLKCSLRTRETCAGWYSTPTCFLITSPPLAAVHKLFSHPYAVAPSSSSSSNFL